MSSLRPTARNRCGLKRARLALTCSAIALSASIGHAQTAGTPATTDRPNVLIIFPDDIGWSNVSAYGRGVMGYTTPNIDALADEGAMFTEHYAQPSSTAGRAALITGQYPIRSGLTTVGRPGTKFGIHPDSPTLAEVLKDVGYATGQFGKNHFGDQNEHLPTMHGFDEFYGSLYHLQVDEEPEQKDYPTDPEFLEKFGPRGLVRSWATADSDATVDPKWGEVGPQRVENLGALTRERMKTVDIEFMDASVEFIQKAHDDDKPYFVWLNPTRMHLYTHLTDESRYLALEHTSEIDLYGSGLIEHDRQIGDYLGRLEEMGALENTIIIYSTDNGAEHAAYTHGGTTPFRGEKMSTYEGGVRVPFIVKWDGMIQPGRVIGGMQAHMDVFTTVAAAAGVENVADMLREDQGQFIDGVNNLDLWLGETDESARDEFFYYYESSVKAWRWKQWKLHFETSPDYYGHWTAEKYPVIYNLHLDPYESFDSDFHRSEMLQPKQWLAGPVQESLRRHVASLVTYPPAQEAPSYNFPEIIRRAMQRK